MTGPVIDLMLRCKFKPDPVPDDVIAAIVTAGQQAPTGQWLTSLDDLLDPLEACGFRVRGPSPP